MSEETRELDLSPNGLTETANLIRSAMPLGTKVSEQLLDWQYNRNPAGRAFGLNAYDGTQLTCHCVVQPLEARLFGQETRGVMSLNAVTHPAYRRKGLYFELARRTYEIARERGYEFGIAVTNHASTPGFISEVGFRLLRPLDVRIGVGPISRRADNGGSDFEKRWTKSQIAWRLTPPEAPYRLTKRGGGFRVLGPAGRPGIEIILADLEAALAPDDPPVRRMGLSPLRLWVGIDHDIDWSRALYLNLPLRLRPSPLFLIFKDLSGRDRVPEPERVRWWGIDFDDF